MAKRLPDEGKLTARVPPEVREEVEILLARLTARHGYRLRTSAQGRNQPLSIEGLVACAVLDFLEKGFDAQRAMLDRRIPELQDLFFKAEAERSRRDQAATQEAPPVRVEIDGVEREPDYVKPDTPAARPGRSPSPSRRQKA